jgi:hypothetical protein
VSHSRWVDPSKPFLVIGGDHGWTTLREVPSDPGPSGGAEMSYLLLAVASLAIALLLLRGALLAIEVLARAAASAAVALLAIGLALVLLAAAASRAIGLSFWSDC